MKGVLALTLLVISFSTQPVVAKDDGEYSNGKILWAQSTPDYIPDELLVMFKEGVPESRINAINESLNVQVITTLQPGRTCLIKVPKEKSLEEVRQAYLSFTEVQVVELNYKIRGL